MDISPIEMTSKADILYTNKKHREQVRALHEKSSNITLWITVLPS